MNWELWKDRFGDYEKIKLFEGFDKIYDKLKKDSSRGKKIYPDHKDTFRALIETPYKDIKAVMIGLAPYHNLKDGKIIADGLCMSTRLDFLPPSLENFYSTLERDFKKKSHIKSPSLEYLAHQGLLLWNVALTVEAGKPTSHVELWRPFQKFFFEEIIAPKGIPVIALGNEAAIVEKWLAPMQWYFKVSHPASASYKGDIWDSQGVFKKLNKLLDTEINFLP